MNSHLEKKLVAIAKERQTKDDPSHDFQHIQRVFSFAKKIAEQEGADLDVVMPAALFHDVVVYRKDSPHSKNETDESADATADILNGIEEYPKEKIPLVQACIRECSFKKALTPSSKESAVLQDADLLESTGAISIIRTFSSGGQMQRQFYSPEDPFREKSEPDVHDASLDLFPTRLLQASGRMHTAYAKKLQKTERSF